MIRAPDSKISRQIKCSICRTDIKNLKAMYQYRVKLGVICSACRECFSEDDIEMIVNLFFAFGGYFGKFDKSEFSMDEAILEFAEELGVNKSPFHIQNIKIWHKVLTHGITPQEFLKELSIIVEQE